jgi:unspecific monooxygenase
MSDQVISDRELLVPARPAPLVADPSLRRFLRAARENPLALWPDEAYETDVVRQRFLGRTRLLITAPDAIAHIFVGNTANYRRASTSVRILRPITGHGLLLSEGEEWRRQRRIVGPALAPRMIQLLVRHIAAGTEKALERLRTVADEPVDLLSTMQALALDIAGRSMFSLEMDRHGPSIRAALNRYAQRHAKPYLLDMLLPADIPTPRDFGRRRFQRDWMRLIDGIMAERMEAPRGNGPRDLFDLLVSARDEETGEGFSHEQLRDQVATLILAGHETSAVTLFWALVLLAQAPVEQERVAEEVAAASFRDEDAAETATKLQRTRAVVNETLRLYPAAFRIARQALADDKAGSIDIPRGALVVVAPWLLHRHRRRWRDPDAFDPSRFMPGAPPPPRFAYMPFGAGPRICVGSHFALAEATYVLAALLREFRVELADPRPILPVGRVVTLPDYRPLFRLIRR